MALKIARVIVNCFDDRLDFILLTTGQGGRPFEWKLDLLTR